jgi:hypothetical protein
MILGLPLEGRLLEELQGLRCCKDLPSVAYLGTHQQTVGRQDQEGLCLGPQQSFLALEKKELQSYISSHPFQGCKATKIVVTCIH